MKAREAEERDLDAMARIWFDGWQDAHARIVPKELARYRTLESFRERLESELPAVRVVGSESGLLGLCIIKADEIYQLYVAAEARGTGVAAVLL
ncbi:MAG: GNAT family N-acetyltransferase, partial [Acidobacteria bacterium]|nr:GNAT family N-acetyltransferase [Acidobacteriota bacterium]